MVSLLGTMYDCQFFLTASHDLDLTSEGRLYEPSNLMESQSFINSHEESDSMSADQLPHVRDDGDEPETHPPSGALYSSHADYEFLNDED